MKILSFEKNKLIALLLLTDLAFIVLHVLYMYTDVINDNIYAVWRDRGPAEFFQYMKFLWVAALFLVLFFWKRQILFFVYSLLFVYFLIDDFFEAHESIGGMLARQFAFQAQLNLRLQDIGELIVFGTVGGFFFMLIVFFYGRGNAYTKTVSRVMIGLILLLAFFGVGIDMLSMMFEDGRVSAFFNFVEDAGEMLVMSLITWFVFRLNPGNDFIPLIQPEMLDRDRAESPEISREA
jgi:hypothetical protein